jgi:hypothetical protein
LLEVLDRRVGQLVQSRYSGNQQISYRDLLPRAIKKEPIAEFLTSRVTRPRDIIAFFNECIKAGVDLHKLTAERVKLAEGEYSKGRFRALGDEWEGEYLGLLDAAHALLRDSPPSFKLSTIQQPKVEDLALRLAIERAEGHLPSVARQCTEGLLPWERFRDFCFNLFYRVGLVGLKIDSSQRASWSDELGRGITSAEIGGETSAVVHRMYWRVLNVSDRAR